jgi:PleD family two-component response regulator
MKKCKARVESDIKCSRVRAVVPCVQVAEDNRINQKVLRMMLQANCAELTIVSDGQQAVEAYNEVGRSTYSINRPTTCITQGYVAAFVVYCSSLV